MSVELPWLRQVRPVLQAEAAECGLACLAMIANFHGHRLNLTGLRQRYPGSIRGTTLAQLIDIASDLDLAPRAVRLEVEELSQLSTPAMLHWDLNHFVVLEKVGAREAVLHDPASGRRRISLKELARHFTGVALELAPATDFKPMEAMKKTRLSDLWSRLVNYRSGLVQLLSLSLLLQLTTLLLPLFLQLTVDEGIAQGDASLLLVLLVGFAFVYAVNGITAGLRSWLMLTMGESISYHLGGNVVRHLLRLPLNFFERRHIGDIMSRVGSIQPIQALLTEGLVSVLIDTVLAVTVVVVMALISPVLTLLVIATTLLYLGASLLLYPALRRRTEEEILARANEETYMLESIRAMRAVKLHGNEALRESSWRSRYADVISASYRTRIFGIQLDFAESLLFGLQFLLVVYLGALAVLSQEMTVGLLLAFLAYRTTFAGSASALVDQLQKWRLLGLHLERLSDIVAERREELIAAPRTALLPAPAIRVEGLTYAYGPTESPVLENLDFEIPAGSLVAITGPSGSGKSTLMRLLLGLVEPSRGQISIDRVPLGPATLSAWRGRIGAVLQDDCLMSGTLADNIAFFDHDLDQRKVEQAAKLARIHHDIMRMPMAYQSLISDMGAALSSGQRQRILLARALYRDPDALFLDEGTANLDEETEAAIADMIATLPITRVVIAHRPALVRKADLVLRFDGGKLVPGSPTDRAVASRAA